MVADVANEELSAIVAAVARALNDCAAAKNSRAAIFAHFSLPQARPALQSLGSFHIPFLVQAFSRNAGFLAVTFGRCRAAGYRQETVNRLDGARRSDDDRQTSRPGRMPPGRFPTFENSTETPVKLVVNVASQPAAIRSGAKAKRLGEGGTEKRVDRGKRHQWIIDSVVNPPRFWNSNWNEGRPKENGKRTGCVIDQKSLCALPIRNRLAWIKS